MSFEFKKISDVGTANPIVARLSFQWIDIFQWFAIPSARQEAVMEIMLLKVQPCVIECEKICDSLKHDIEDAKKLKVDSQESDIKTPHTSEFGEKTRCFLEAATEALNALEGIFLSLFGLDTSIKGLGAIAGWAEKSFGEFDLMTVLLNRANAGWINRLNAALDAVKCDQHRSSLTINDLEIWNCNLLPFFEETLMAALLHAPMHMQVSFVEIPENERDPTAPTRYRAVFKSPDGKTTVPAGAFTKQQTVIPELQRMLQQGRGRRIIAHAFNGEWFVATGSRLYHSPRWKTFHDFLLYYIKDILGGEWANLDLKKSRDKRHPLMNWYEDIARFLNARIVERGKPADAPMTSLVAAYIGLAYNLYLISHNNGKVHNLLVHRLKHRDQFYGAYQEAVAAGILIRAGFDLEMEDETDSTSSHCEFTATHRSSAKNFSVEAKIRLSAKRPPSIIGQLYKALKKKAAHARLIFIEVNAETGGTIEGQITMLKGLLADIRNHESILTIGDQPPPPAFLVLTNNPPGTIETVHLPARLKGLRFQIFE